MKYLYTSLTFLFICVKIYAQENIITVKVNEPQDTISKHIYGHFAEHLGRGIYDGFYVGKDSEIPNTNGIRTDVVEALRELQIPVLRWPGGCFAEQYQWRDGIGPVDERPLVVNTFWGGVTEDNSFGTHEFLQLCEMLDTEPYIAVNIASGTYSAGTAIENAFMTATEGIAQARSYIDALEGELKLILNSRPREIPDMMNLNNLFSGSYGLSSRIVASCILPKISIFNF